KRYNFDPSLGSYPEVVYGYLPSGDNLHRVGSQLGRVGEHLRHRGSPCMFSLSSPPSSSSPSSSSCSGSTAPPASSACCCSPSASRPTARPSVPPGRSCSPYWWRGPPCEAPRPPSGGPRARTATAPLRPCGRRQLVSTSSELIVSHSALNHRWDCSTNVVSRGPAPCAKENSIDRMPWASYICRLSWSMRVSWRDRV